MLLLVCMVAQCVPSPQRTYLPDIVQGRPKILVKFIFRKSVPNIGYWLSIQVQEGIYLGRR